MEEAGTVMRRLKNWLMLRFLPVWAKESVYEENKRLREKADALQRRVELLNAYIDGLEAGIRAQRRIIINNEVKEK